MILIRGTDAKWQYDTHDFPPANCTLLRSVAGSESRCFYTLTDQERSWFHYMKENKFILSSRGVKVGSNSAAAEAAKLVCNNPASASGLTEWWSLSHPGLAFTLHYLYAFSDEMGCSRSKSLWWTKQVLYTHRRRRKWPTSVVNKFIKIRVMKQNHHDKMGSSQLLKNIYPEDSQISDVSQATHYSSFTILS